MNQQRAPHTSISEACRGLQEAGKRTGALFAIAVILAAVLTGMAAGALFQNSRIVTNYPNPFDSRQETTTILYTLVAEARVQVKIYDLFGNLVKEYPSLRETAGMKRIRWDGTNDAGHKVAKGGYICVVEIDSGAVQVLAARKIGVLH